MTTTVMCAETVGRLVSRPRPGSARRTKRRRCTDSSCCCVRAAPGCGSCVKFSVECRQSDERTHHIAKRSPHCAGQAWTGACCCAARPNAKLLVRGGVRSPPMRNRGSSSVGRAPASQAGCRGFEPRLPLINEIRIYIKSICNLVLRPAPVPRGYGRTFRQNYDARLQAFALDLLPLH